MSTLSESVVLTRSRAASLAEVKALNCWFEKMVSIVRRMPNVEVLSLSVNSISSLQDFSFCSNLTELYLRKNQIADITEVAALKCLSKLKFLWLSGNPVENSVNYRYTVIKAIPSLHKLDDIAVTPEEVIAAAKLGSDLPTPAAPIGAQVAEAAPVKSNRASDVEEVVETDESENVVLKAVMLLMRTLSTGDLKLLATNIKNEVRSRRPK